MSVLEQMFEGFGGSKALLESNCYSDLSFTVDMEVCPFTVRSLTEACQALALMLNDGERMVACPSYVRNQSVNPNYWDPKPVQGKFHIPEKVGSLLRRRRVFKVKP